MSIPEVIFETLGVLLGIDLPESRKGRVLGIAGVLVVVGVVAVLVVLNAYKII